MQTWVSHLERNCFHPHGQIGQPSADNSIFSVGYGAEGKERTLPLTLTVAGSLSSESEDSSLSTFLTGLTATLFFF